MEINQIKKSLKKYGLNFNDKVVKAIKDIHKGEGGGGISSDTDPLMDGVASPGISVEYSRGDHCHPSDASKQDVLESGESIKTINSESLLGSGDIKIEGGGKMPMEYHGYLHTTLELKPNVMHFWEEIEELEITLATGELDDANLYKLRFESGDTPTVFTYPSYLLWEDGAPTIKPYSYYTITIEDSIASYKEVSWAPATHQASDTISFRDPEVKRILVANWGGADGGTAAANTRLNSTVVTGVAGEMTYEQAASVVTLGNVFKNNTTMKYFDEFTFFTNINLSDNNDPFNGCKNLISIKLPKTLTGAVPTVVPIDNISWNTYPIFYGCESLRTLYIPDGVTDIYGICCYTTTYDPVTYQQVYSPHVYKYNTTMLGYSNLRSIRLPEDIHIYFITGTAIKELHIPEGVKFGLPNPYGGSVSGFSHNPLLEKVVIDNDIIGYSEFSSCVNLKEIVINNTIQQIGTGAFMGTGIDNIEWWPENIHEIPSSCFTGCNNLKELVVPDHITSIGGYAFSGGSYYENGANVYIRALTDLVLNEGLLSIGDNAFAYQGLMEIELPSTLTSIGNSAFSNNPITSVYIPAALETIGSGAFPNTVETIEVDENNQKYDSRDNCNGIVETATDTLVYATLNTTIPASVHKLGTRVYSGFPITEIDLTNITEIGQYALSNTDIESIIIPDNVTSILNYAFSSNQKLQSVQLGSGVTTIADYMFYNCFNLSEVVFPEGLTSINSHAFEYCGLSEVHIPEGVTLLGSNVFQGCPITSLTIPSTVTAIPAYFNNGNDYQGDKEFMTTIIIPDSVTTIGTNAFARYYNPTEEIVLGSGLTSIGESAFAALPGGGPATHALRTITCKAVTPPTLGSNVFTLAVQGQQSWEYSYIIPPTLEHIYVPAESVEAYKAASGWSTYASYIEAIPED